MKHAARSRPWSSARSAFAGFRFPAEVDRCRGAVVPALTLSYSDIEELLTERGIEVDHVAIDRWLQRFTLLLAHGARFSRHAPRDR